MPPELIIPIIRLKEPPDKDPPDKDPPHKPIPVSVTKKTLRLDRVVASKEERFFIRSVIKMKLNGFVQDPTYSSKIEEVVKTMNRIAFLAYHFINLHFLLLLQDDNPRFPKLNSHFFYEVCSRVTTLNTQRKKIGSDPLMDRTSDRFQSLLPNGKETLPNRNRLGALINNLVTFLSTATHNHLNLNFEKRLAFWFRINHGVSDRCKVQYIIDKIFLRRKWPSKFDGDPEAQFLISEYQRRFANPTSKTKISEKLEIFLPFYYGMLKEFTEKKKKLFSLFPLKSSLIPGHIRIDSSGLRDLLALWTGETANKNFLKNRKAGWSEVFRINSVGTKKQWFSWEITTNGYDVSIGFRKPVPEFQYSEKQWSGFPDSEKNKILDGLIKKEKGRNVSGSPEEETFSSYELGESRRAGLDPGMSALFTVRDSDGKDLQCTKGEYRTLTGQKKVVKAMNRRKDRNPLLKEYNLVFKTPDPIAYGEDLKSLLEQLDGLEGEYSESYYRKQKFTSYTRIQKVFRKLGKRLKSRDGRKTILGYGDGSVNNSGIRGNYLPVKGFKRYLERCFRKHIRVVTVDEFRTTKMCSSCEEKTGTVHYPQEVGKGGEALSYRKVIYGVRRCKNNECRITWNRDKNAARNILHLLNCKIESRARPLYLSREKQKQSGKPPVNPDLTGISLLVHEPIKICPVLQGGLVRCGTSNSLDI